MAREYKYILATTDYFFKWAKVVPVRDIFSTMVASDLYHLRLGIPDSITVDNSQPFKSVAVYKLHDKYRIEGNHSSWYYASANGLVEAFNKTLDTILEKNKN